MAGVSGHTFLKRGKRGAAWFAKYRLADGRQVKRKLGPAWEGRGRAPAGHLTARAAEEALQEILADARRGTLQGSSRTGATFEDAAAEYLRYVTDVRGIDPATAADYRGVIDGYLVPEFGGQPLEAVTP